MTNGVFPGTTVANSGLDCPLCSTDAVELNAVTTTVTSPPPVDDAGFTGFTLNNNLYGTNESIARVGELIKAVRGSAVSA